MVTLPDIADVYCIFEALSWSGRECCARGLESRAGGHEGKLGGKLVLYGGLDARGAATALASNIGGAASLGLDADAERLKGALRAGVCDFVVNQLDEAIRILKNEIRKKQPVAVGLVCDVAACLGAMVERGVQPDVLGPSSPESQGAYAEFAARGACLLRFDQAGDGGLTAASELREEVWWSVAESPAKWLPALDALAVEVLLAGGAEDDERVRWVRAAPRYFVRAPQHYLKLSPVEVDRFIEMIEVRRRSGAIAVAATVRRRFGVSDKLLAL